MKRRKRRRLGFSVIEAAIVSGLMAMLAVLLSAAWAGFGRPTVDVLTRCQITQEMDLAAAYLGRDFGGSLPGDDARLGVQKRSRLVGWTHPGDAQLWLCFDGGTEPNGTADWASPDTVVVYRVEDGQLIREDQTSGLRMTVARNVQSMEVVPGDNSMAAIRLTLSYRTLTRTFTLNARVPQL